MIEEKKLTDKELVKNIEYCMTHDDCSEDCPMGNVQACMLIMLEQSLDLIHRLQDENAKQKAEIEQLEKDVHDMSWIIKIHKYCVGADHCQNSSMKEFKLQKQVAELKEELENKKAEEGEIYKWAKNNIFGGVE